MLLQWKLLSFLVVQDWLGDCQGGLSWGREVNVLEILCAFWYIHGVAQQFLEFSSTVRLTSKSRSKPKFKSNFNSQSVLYSPLYCGSISALLFSGKHGCCIIQNLTRVFKFLLLPKVRKRTKMGLENKRTRIRPNDEVEWGTWWQPSSLLSSVWPELILPNPKAPFAAGENRA